MTQFKKLNFPLLFIQFNRPLLADLPLEIIYSLLFYWKFDYCSVDII